jgi:AhpD family alkylhydroperoxidase
MNGGFIVKKEVKLNNLILKQTQMERQFDLLTVMPKTYKSLSAFDGLLDDADLDKIQLEMIKIRTSQINGCAYCLHLHTQESLKYGERQQRIFLMSAWREARSWFNEKDRVILELTEQVTLISNQGVNDELFQKAISLFGEKTTAQIIIAIVSINAWNRLGIAFHMQHVPSHRSGCM